MYLTFDEIKFQNSLLSFENNVDSDQQASGVLLHLSRWPPGQKIEKNHLLNHMPKLKMVHTYVMLSTKVAQTVSSGERKGQLGLKME